MTRKILFLLSLCLVTGCASTRPAEKKLAIVVLTYSLPDADREETVWLPNDYGFLVKWNDTEPPEFCLYDKPSQQIRHTADFSAFLDGLSEFPDGAKVDWIRGCSGGFAWAMPADQRKRLDEIITANKFKLTGEKDDNFTICTCESKEVKLLKTVNKPMPAASQ